MRKIIEQAGASLAFGGLLYIGGYQLTDSMEINLEQVNRSVEACIAQAHLGQKAIQASEIPKECIPFTSTFSAITTTVTSYVPHDPNQLHSVSTSSTVYTFPPKETFEAENIKKEDDVEFAHRKHQAIAIGVGILGLVLAGAAYYQNTVTDRRLRDLLSHESKSSRWFNRDKPV